MLALALAIRTFDLGGIPAGFYCDEASTGYDAWSLLKTGKDQYGEPFPLFARSFGDYNESTYRVLTIPFVAAVGLNETAVRLPAALAGTLTVGLLFLVVRRLLDRRTAMLAALLLAISPWHVHLSRAGLRSVLLPAALLLGLWLLLRGLRSPRWLPFAGCAFALALHTYSPARVFVPLFGVVLAVVFRRELRAGGRWALAGAAVPLVVGAALFPHWTSEAGMARARFELESGVGAMASNYLSYFDPRFLFLRGDPVLRNNPTGVAMLHPFEGVTVLVGLVMFLRRRDRVTALLLAWLLLHPIPGALTGPGNALRGIVGAPAWAAISAIGLSALLRLVSGSAPGRRGRLAVGAAAVVLTVSLAHYAREYFVRYPVESHAEWQYGMREAIEVAESGDHDTVVFSDGFFLPHVFILFYARVPPEEYQADPLTGLAQGRWGYTDVSIGRYRVTSLEKMPTSGRHLLVLPAGESRAMMQRFGHRLVHAVEAPDGRNVIGLLEPAR